MLNHCQNLPPNNPPYHFLNIMPFRLLIGLLLVLFCSLSLAEKDEFSLNLNEVDMRVMIDTVADITGKNFIVDPRVVGKVSVVTSKPMQAKQIYEIFLSILKVHGFSAVTSGNIVKIVPNVNAKQESTDYEPAMGDDELLTKMIQLHHVDATEMVQILQPLMPQHAFMAAFSGSNVIVLSDTAGNVNRLTQMIAQMDKSGDVKIEVINLKQANATEVVTTLSTLINSRSSGKTGIFIPSLVADSRSNSILLGGDPASRLEMRALIAHLDNPVAEENGNTEVIYLHYAQAKDLLETLTGINNAKGAKGDKSDINAQAKTEVSTQKEADIRADIATNALVITAPADEMRSLKSVIRQLDIRRAQVHIEAIIAKINFTKKQEVGISWSNNKIKTSNNTPSFDSLGNFVNTVGKSFSVGYLVGGEISALLAALATDNDVNVLATPSIVTLDNEEASMIVGQNIGIKSGSFANNSGGLGSAATTFQREDVGTKLKVTPLINEGNAVKLKIKQEVSGVATGATPEAGPSIDKSEIETAVLVDDGAILVLGGLISDDVQETVTKVPLLGDIPYIGHLFQNTTTDVKKSN